MSTIKEVFFPATTLSTPSSKLVSGTLAEWLEPRPRRWNNSQGWTGVWGRSGDLSRGTRSSLWTFHSPGLGGGDLPRAARASLGTVHLPVSPLAKSWACFCDGLWVWACLCPVSQLVASEPGGRLNPRSGMTWARLISSLNCCRQKGIFSFSLTVFFSLSLLLSIIEHLEGYF